MVLRKEVITERLKELDKILKELSKYENIKLEEIKASLSKRWIIERGLIACCNLIFDIADHILASHYSVYPATYEESLEKLHSNKVISNNLYKNMKGLGGFRNVLVHEYIDIDMEELLNNFRKSFRVFTQFINEIDKWCERIKNQKNKKAN